MKESRIELIDKIRIRINGMEFDIDPFKKLRR